MTSEGPNDETFVANVFVTEELICMIFPNGTRGRAFVPISGICVAVGHV